MNDIDDKEYQKYNDLEKLSAIMKGLIEHKKEIETLEKLILKYPDKAALIIADTQGVRYFIPIG